MTSTYSDGLPSSIFSHIPAAEVASKALALETPASAIAKPATAASSSRNPDRMFCIVITFAGHETNGSRVRPFRGWFQCVEPAIAQPPACTGHIPAMNQLTPSFFCRLDDEVVYWNTSRLSG